MSATHTPTTTETNLTVPEREALRHADLFSQEKALTLGGNEPFTTGVSQTFADHLSPTPTEEPGKGLGTFTKVNLPAEVASWYGPTQPTQGTEGRALNISTWQDLTQTFGLSVLPGDVLLVKAKSGSTTDNAYAVGTVSALTGTTLTLTNIVNPSNVGSEDELDPAPLEVGWSYIVIRPNAKRLFALPGSGPLGSEQAFLFVDSSAPHTVAAPRLDGIEGARITKIVPPQLGTGDRADSVYDFGARTGLDKLGYRVVLYPDNGAGAPDLTKPITSTTPVLDSTKPAADQRMTVDYHAGVVRFAIPPVTGSEVKPSALCVEPATGRLRLYAVYWASQPTVAPYVEGAPKELYHVRSDEYDAKAAGFVRYDAAREAWLLGATDTGEELYVQALTGTGVTYFGVQDSTTPLSTERYFAYTQGDNAWKFKRQPLTEPVTDPATSMDLVVADKTAFTVGAGANPPQNPGGDYNPSGLVGYRDPTTKLQEAVKAAILDGYGEVHLRRGEYRLTSTVTVPPGVKITGEGAATRVVSKPDGAGDAHALFKFGANTPWGVWDADYPLSGSYTPPSVTLDPTARIEGYDIVWNPVRRVWGVTWADSVANEVYFREVDLQGQWSSQTLTVATLPLFTRFTAHALAPHHTTGHYPRMVHVEGTDEYVVVYVRDTGAGPESVIETVKRLAGAFSLKFPSTTVTGDYANNSTPSLASSGSEVRLAFSSFASDYSTVSVQTASYDVGTGLLTPVDTTGDRDANRIITSVDIAAKNDSTYAVVWSERQGLLVTSVCGTTVSSNVVTVGGIIVLLLLPGMRFLCHDNLASVDNGRSGVIVGVAGLNVTVAFDDGDQFFHSNTAGFNFSAAPLSTIYAATSTDMAGGSTLLVVVAGGEITSFYSRDEREPDFVRICRGGDGWLIVYQLFDTVARLAGDTMRNLDDGFNTVFYDSSATYPPDGDVPLASLSVHREYLSTCFALLGDNFTLTGPTPSDRTGLNPTSLSDFPAMGADTHRTGRVLGGRKPIRVPWANSVLNTSRPELEVSARNYCHAWNLVDDKVPSLLPDVTWTGEDWMVVSPTMAGIWSDTGVISNDAGTEILTDESFIFGTGSSPTSNNDGSFLPLTVTPFSDAVYFPVTGETVLITGVRSEHVIELASIPVAPVGIPGSQKEWCLVNGSTTLGLSGGMPNLGFRVSTKGEVLTTSSYLTFAIPESVSTSRPRSQEVLNRSLWGDATFSTRKYGDTSLSWNDQVSTSKLAADLTVQGVTLGAPKPTSEQARLESPLCAIAWGENTYGLVDRITGGIGGGRVNKLNFYRQSFGRWNSSLESMTLTGGAATLSQESFEHVYTRHGWVTSAQVGWSTDGYRTFFPHFTARFLKGLMNTGSLFDLASGDPARDTDWFVDLSAMVADQEGGHGVRVRGTPFALTPTRDPTDNFLGIANVPGVGLTNLNTMQPKSLWNGRDWVVFFPGVLVNAQPANAISIEKMMHHRGVISMVVFPGEGLEMDGALVGDELTNPAALATNLRSAKVVATGHITCGAYNLSMNREVVLLDVAYSGKTYCVVWSMGLQTTDPSTVSTAFTGANGGNLIGYTLFHDSTGTTTAFGNVVSGSISAPDTFDPGGGVTHLLELDSTIPGLTVDNQQRKARFLSPKIIWDGKQFQIFVVHRDDNYGALATDHGFMKQVAVAEDGSGHTLQMRNAANRYVPVAGYGTARVLGQFTIDPYLKPAGAKLVLRLNLTTSGPFGEYGGVVLPGDTLVITKVTDLLGTLEEFKLAGVYTVTDYDAQNGYVSLSADFDSTLAGPSYLAYGYLLSGGMAAKRDAPSGALTNAGQNYLQTVVSTEPTSTLQNMVRIWDTAYNEENGEYTLLVEAEGDGGFFLGLLAFSRSTGSVVREVELAGIVGPVTYLDASLAWNGDRYFVAAAKKDAIAGESVDTYLVSRDFMVEEANAPAYVPTDFVGNTGRKMPGPGYGAYSAASNLPLASFRGVKVKWNPVLGRWGLAVSLVWSGHGAAQLYQTGWNVRSLLDEPATTLGVGVRVGRDFGLTVGTAYRQPGMRFLTQRLTPLFGLTAPDFASSLPQVIADTVTLVNSSQNAKVGDLFAVAGRGPGGTDIRRTATLFGGAALDNASVDMPWNDATNAIDVAVGDYDAVPPDGTFTVVGRLAQYNLLFNEGAGVTYTATSLTDTDVFPGFITMGVQPGDRVYVGGNALVYVLSVAPTVLTTTPFGVLPPAGTHYTVTRPSSYLYNLKSSLSTILLTGDVDAATQRTPLLESTGGHTLEFLPREDVFLITLGYGTPCVEVDGAEGVALSNLTLGGSQDITVKVAQHPWLAQSGLAVGCVDSGSPLYPKRPSLAFRFPVPREAPVTLSNVVSRTKMRYKGVLAMGATLYLIDLYNDEINAALSDSAAALTSKEVTGNYVIPYGLSLPLLAPPTSRANLLLQKHQGLLAMHPGFTNQAYDDCLDANGFDLTYPFTLGSFGERGSIKFNTAQTVMVPLAFAPAQVVLNFEPYTYSDSDNATGLYQRTYQEVAPSVFTATASFNNGATFVSLLAGGLESIPLADQGNQFILRLTLAFPGPHVGLAGWSLLY